jgi:hypothetical protein|eukprot:7382499-Prymnesium_polylepis.1
MAPRFLTEKLFGTVETTVTYALEQRQIQVVDKEIASPGGSCPMLRSYLYVPTPQALQISACTRRTCGDTFSLRRSSRAPLRLTRSSARSGVLRTVHATRIAVHGMLQRTGLPRSLVRRQAWRRLAPARARAIARAAVQWTALSSRGCLRRLL